MIIGKGGSYIKQIKEQTGAYIQLSQKPKDVSLPERCITVSGKYQICVLTGPRPGVAFVSARGGFRGSVLEVPLNHEGPGRKDAWDGGGYHFAKKKELNGFLVELRSRDCPPSEVGVAHFLDQTKFLEF